MDAMPNAVGLEAVVAELRREFAEGLGERLELIGAALGELASSGDSTVIERLYVRAHALEGTAAAYGAHELSTCAAALARHARSWRGGEGPDQGELGVARRLLEALATAARAFQAEGGRPTP